MNKIIVSKKIALVFFTLGTLLFLTQSIIRGLNMVTVIGYYYLYLSVIINLVLVIILTVRLVLGKNKIDTLKAIGILSINIPIASIYAYLVLNHLI